MTLLKTLDLHHGVFVQNQRPVCQPVGSVVVNLKENDKGPDHAVRKSEAKLSVLQARR